MLDIDFEAHNEQAREVWRRFNEGDPIRVPMHLGLSSRFTVLSDDSEKNPRGITYRDYFLDPDVMFEQQLQHQYWIRHNLLSDAELGIPEVWTANVDFQNSLTQLWYGCELAFIEGDVPDTPPCLTDANKWELIQKGPPEPFAGWMGRVREYYERFQEKARSYEFHGRPVQVGGVPGRGTDGPFTIACSLRGATEICLDMYVDPDFYHALMELLVEGCIRRVNAFREWLGDPVATTAWSFADDSIQLVSEGTYRELILPYHRRLIDEFGRDGPNSIHLCGDATHLFKTIRDELHVQSFDTGFPVDHGWLREELGPDVRVNGGPHVEFLRSGSPAQVRAETRRILQSGIMEGGRFVLREGNNLAPGTPPGNVAAMYEGCREWGGYGGNSERPS